MTPMPGHTSDTPTFAVFVEAQSNSAADRVVLTPTFDPDAVGAETARTYHTLTEAFRKQGWSVVIDDAAVAPAFSDCVNGDELPVATALDRIYGALAGRTDGGRRAPAGG